MIVTETGIGARVFPADLSRWLVEYYREKGVTVLIGKAPTGSKRETGSSGFAPARTGRWSADAVVAGLGIEPNVELARQAGLAVSDGIEVDEQLRTSRPEIYAAGDVASFLIRPWASASASSTRTTPTRWARSAGRNMAGAGRRTITCRSSTRISSSWATKRSGTWSAARDRGRLEGAEFREGVVYYLEDGRVRGVLLWNTWGQVDAARALIAEPGPFRPEQLKGRLPAA